MGNRTDPNRLAKHGSAALLSLTTYYDTTIPNSYLLAPLFLRKYFKAARYSQRTYGRIFSQSASLRMGICFRSSTVLKGPCCCRYATMMRARGLPM